MNFYPILLREMIIFKRRLLKFGYLFSSMMTPVLYLVTFGLGLGRGMTIEGMSYLSFVVPGICAMSSMTNSFTWISTSISVGRLHFKTFDEYRISPVKSSDIMMGEILSGMIRGLFASSLVLLAGAAFGAGFPRNPVFFLAWGLNCLIFACLGVISGYLAKSHEDTALFSNFIIMPMAFFCGTFFPIERLPGFIRSALYCLPLTHSTKIMRSGFLGLPTDPASLVMLPVIFILAFFLGVITIGRSYK